MTALELADAMEIRASIRKKATNRKSVQENANDRLADQLNQAATMLRNQQAEIEGLKEELKRYADAIGEERGNKALRNNEIGKILTKVLDDCGLLKKASEK